MSIKDGVIIVGAGAAGCSVAYHLARPALTTHKLFHCDSSQQGPFSFRNYTLTLPDFPHPPNLECPASGIHSKFVSFDTYCSALRYKGFAIRNFLLEIVFLIASR
jgi:flavin-dependent dehydrogenase